MAKRALSWKRAGSIGWRDLRSAPGKFCFVVLSVAVGVAAELQARYDAPGGLLPDEVLATGTWTAGEPGSDD